MSVERLTTRPDHDNSGEHVLVLSRVVSSLIKISVVRIAIFLFRKVVIRPTESLVSKPKPSRLVSMLKCRFPQFLGFSSFKTKTRKSLLKTQKLGKSIFQY